MIPREARARRAARPLAAALLAALAAPFVTPSPVSAGAGPDAPVNPRRDAYKTRYAGKTAPDFALSDTQGHDVRLSSLRGHVVLLNFWYSGCPPCRKETPDLVTLHRLYGREGLTILGMNLDDVLIPAEGHAPLAAFLKEFQVPYPVLMVDNKTFDAYGGIPVQPISFLIDRTGTIVHIFWGAFPGPVFEKTIKPYLTPAPGPASPPAPAAPRP
ncbi:MAG TPA: TlpA disulfide reductase family protein [Patescibacteria group bacterium]|nr:TlpA disulfide reductase family protein [Patescibacteria group bacterium]